MEELRLRPDVRRADSTWPLTGRGEELALISEALRGGAVSGLMLAGAAGVGKTRLALEALAVAEQGGYATTWATATHSASSSPFGALARVLPSDLGSGTPVGLLARAGNALVERAGGRRLALAVDDAHLLDSSSAALILQLATAGSAFVIVTVRTGGAVPDAVSALWKDNLCQYLELQALSQEEVEELLNRVLGAPVDGGTSVALGDRSARNVLFLRELVREGLERGALALTGAGLWRWRGSFAAGQRLVDLIEMRLGALSREERSLLELVVLGEPLEGRLLEGLGGSDTLDGLERRGLVEISRERRRITVRPGHPLFGDAVRARCSPLRAAGVYGELADALAKTGARRREDLLRLAMWRLEAGGKSEPEFLLAAAARAGAAFDFGLAERLADAAIDAGGGRRARYARAEAVRGQGRFEEAEALFASLAAGAETDAERSAVAQARVVNLHWGLGHSSDAEAVVRAAEASVTEPDARDELAVVRAWLADRSNRPLEAIEAVSHLLARESIADGLGVRTALAVAFSLALAGRAEQAVALVERWHGVAARLTDEIPLAQHQLESARTLALYLAGHLAEAGARAEASYRSAIAAGTHEGAAVWSMIVGKVAIERGSLRTAVRWLSESAALLREFDPVGSLGWTLGLLAQAHGQLGETGPAEAAWTEIEATRGNARMVLEVDVLLGGAWAAAARGDLSAARRLALEAAERAEAHGQRGLAVPAYHDLARLGGGAAAAPRLASLAEFVQGPLAVACSLHAQALASGNAQELEQAARSFETIGTLLRAAEAATDTAVAYQAAGKLSSSRALEARARLLVGRCEGARTPALARLGFADDLTAREREIALLAAGGMTNREIASRLVVSVRTVENHLQHAYGKLAIANRRELAGLVQQPDAPPAGERRPETE